MIIKVKRADGETEIYESPNYRISNCKDFHPLIISVTVYDNGKKIAKAVRPFKFIYKHFTFKTKKIQDILEKLRKEDANAKN